MTTTTITYNSSTGRLTIHHSDKTVTATTDVEAALEEMALLTTSIIVAMKDTKPCRK